MIPKFKEQIAKGGPVTVTHPDIIRHCRKDEPAARALLREPVPESADGSAA